MTTAVDPYREAADHGGLRFLHRLNPLAKLAGPLPAMVLLIFARDVATPLAFLALTLGVLFVGAHLGRRAVVGILLGLPLLVGVMSVSLGVWADASRVDRAVVLVQLGGYRFYLGSLQLGLATAVRLVSLLALAAVAGVTSTGPDLVRAMVQQLRVPYRIGYTALAAFRFVPRFGHELEVIRAAHRVRGMAGGRGPLAGPRRRLGYVVPLLAGAIRHAERVALAMDARAFGAHPRRTERHVVPFRRRDGLFVAACWIVTVAIPITVGA